MSAIRKHKQVRFYVSILIKLIIPFAISALTVLVLVTATDLLKFRYVLQSANLTFLFIAILKVPLIILIMMLKWRQILVDREYVLSWRSLSEGVMIGFFFNNITPGLKIGGEPLRAYYLAQNNNIAFKPVMASVVTEKMLQGVTLIFITLLAITLGFLSNLPISSLKLFLAGTIGFTVLISFFLYISLFKFQWIKNNLIKAFSFLRFIPRFKLNSFGEKLQQGMEDIHQEYSASLSNKHTLTLVIGFSIIQIILDFLQPYLIFKALNVSIPIVFIIISATAVKLVSILGITPGGSGIAEGVNFGFYAFLFSISEEIAAVHTFLSRALDTWFIWILSAITMFFIRPDLFFRERFLTHR